MRFLVLLLPLLFVAPLRADDCDVLPKPSVTVKRLDQQVSVNRQYGYKELNHLGSTLAVKGQHILGLTRGEAVARFSTSTPSRVDRSGRWECASPQIVLSVGFSPMTLYVAREFPQGSCAYKEIHEHELRHVKAYEEHLGRIAKDLAETLTQRFATGAPWRGPVGQTHERVQREIAERWLPWVERELDKADEAQALIDTPEEYARVADSCQGEIRKRLR